MRWIKELTRLLWKDELKTIDELRSQRDYYKKEFDRVYDETIDLNKELTAKLDIIHNLENKPEHTTPTNWMLYEPVYKTIDGLSVHPSTFITINDRKLKRHLIKAKFHELPFNELIYVLEDWVHHRIRYVPDTGFNDDWRSAAYIYTKKEDDCDGKAILYQTCMHILGYGDESVCKLAKCIFPGFTGGHKYNKVLIDNEWIIIDPTNPRELRTNGEWEYDLPMRGLGWFYNYWGAYKSDDI